MVLQLFQRPSGHASRAVIQLAHKIGLELQITSISEEQEEHLTEEFLQKNPFHTLPTLNDDGFYLMESRAIMTYLVTKYAPNSDLYPKDPQQRATVDSMLQFDNVNVATRRGRRIHVLKETGKDLSEKALERDKDTLKCLDRALQTRKYAAGDHLTIADFSLIHSLSLVEALEEDLSSFLYLRLYMSRVKDELGSCFKNMNESAILGIRKLLNNRKTH